MDAGCPGKKANAGLEPTLMACPGCGREVELFGDEQRVVCRCGRSVFREGLPACFQWCPAAEQCLGQITGNPAKAAEKIHSDPGREGEKKRLVELKGQIASALARCPHPGCPPALKPGAKLAPALPPAGRKYERAFAKGLEQLRAGEDAARFAALGALPAGPGRYEVAVLDGTFTVDLQAGTVRATGGSWAKEGEVDPGSGWAILALHYLGVSMPGREPAGWISFADLAEARTYNQVYSGRVLGRLCATAGRDRERFVRACSRLRGEPFEQGEAGFKFQVFPRVQMAVAWYSGDEELKPGAAMVLPDTIADYFCVEDIVVLSESLVGRLQAAASECS